MVANSFPKPIASLRLCALLLLAAFSRGPLVHAELLPVKTYTTVDGLLRDQVFRIKQDSRGFLWFCTQGGLSRFDGYQFTNYTMDDGLPSPEVNDLVEGGDGTIWIATLNGLVRFNPRGKRGPYSPQTNQNDSLMFEVFPAGSDKLDKRIDVLLADEQRLVWVGTDRALYRMKVENGQPQFVKTIVSTTTLSLIKDHRGGLWAGTFSEGLYRLSSDGATVLQHFTSAEGLPRVYGQRSAEIASVLEDRDGNIWAAHEGVCELAFDSGAIRYAVSRCYNKKDGLSADWINSVFQSSDGTLWIGTAKGLNRLSRKDTANGFAFQSFTTAQGFCNDEILELAADREGSLWVGAQCGLKKWVPSGFTGYDTKDGLSSLKIDSFLETVSGEMIFTDHQSDARLLNLFSAGKFKTIRPNYPPEIDYWGWGWKQSVLQTHDGEWWISVGMSDEYLKRFKEMPPDGPLIVRFPRVDKLEDLAHVKPKAVYTPHDDLLGYNTFRMYEDRNGDVWLVTLDPSRLFKWERKTEKFHELTEAADLGGNGYLQVFREDHEGNLWIGAGITFKHDPSRTFSLLRYKDGRFTQFSAADGLPEGTIRDLLIDGAGRLWLASSRGGVLRVEDPNAARPQFKTYTTAQGLSDDTTSSLTEDLFGRIYIGSGRGVDRLDPATGAIKHFTTVDGVPAGEIALSYRDRTGALWFAGQGLARYLPEAEHPRQPPNILLTGLRVSNVPQPVSALGETELPKIEFAAAQNNLSIDFLGLGANLGEELRYKYKLEGADADWITTTQRTVNFSNLAPGTYRFLVKAATAEGLESTKPSVFSFTIPRPVWQRWWFVSLALLVLGSLAFGAYRYRVNRLLEIERVRTRIATDLHDDIGSNLSKISILSEVARQQYEQDGNGETPLGSIANISRESVASMSDIVWAINPQKDRLVDLVRRMRRFAEDTLESRNIAADFRAPEATSELRLGADARRQIYLIFKECINNIVRHSQATEATIDLRIEAKELVLAISDNGKGFDASREYEGNGLASMQRRAQEFGGDLKIDSVEGKGTQITLRMPLSVHEWFTLRK